MTETTIIPLIIMFINSKIQIPDSRGVAVAGSKPCAIVRNTTTASKSVTEKPILSPDSCGKKKTQIFSSAMNTTGNIRVINKNTGRRL